MYFFTVFTPTYNRAHTLNRVFESLEKQTFRDFEWLIVDDGSTDNTADLVADFQQRSTFPIRYFFQNNQGKHIAFNRGVALARSPLFLTLDSDDACLPEALAVFKENWEKIDPSVRAEFCGVTARCQNQNGEIVGKKSIPTGKLDISALDLRYRLGISYEMWGFIRTDILQKFPFPEDIKNAYVTEATVWNLIAQQYKTRFLNTVLRIYFTEDQQQSITKQLKPQQKRNFLGMVRYYQQVLNTELRYFRFAPVQFLKAAIQYRRYGLTIPLSFTAQFLGLNSWFSRFLFVVTAPIARLFYFFDLRKTPQ